MPQTMIRTYGQYFAVVILKLSILCEHIRQHAAAIFIDDLIGGICATGDADSSILQTFVGQDDDIAVFIRCHQIEGSALRT